MVDSHGSATAAEAGGQQRRARGLGRAGPVALLGTIIPILGSVTMVIAGPMLAGWFRGQGIAGAAWFALAFTLLGAVAFAPTYTTSVIAGWTFGFTVGFSAVVVGTVGGAMLCYVTARWLGGQRVASLFEAHPRWDVVRQALLQEDALKALWIVFLLRLSPVLPFGTTNVLLATTGVSPGIYLLGTLLGLAPRTGLVAFAAASAQQMEQTSPDWWGIGMGIAATIICIITMGIAGKRALDRATRMHLPPPDAQVPIPDDQSGI